jgi:hypothetical protein
MNKHVERLMVKRGIRDVNSLNPEEKAAVMEWERRLSKPDLTVPDVVAFCRERLAAIEGRWADASVTDGERLRLVERHCVLKAILGAIDGPGKEREETERWLIAQTS